MGWQKCSGIRRSYLEGVDAFNNKEHLRKGEKSSKQITCCNDQKSTVARKGKSRAFQRDLMNSGTRTRRHNHLNGVIQEAFEQASS